RMRIDSSGDVLIGGMQKQSPSGIDKGMFIQSQTNGDVVGVNLYANETVNNRRADFFLDDTNGIYGVQSTASTGLPDFVIKSASNERFRVANDGKVGIGTSSPSAALDVVGEATFGSGTYGVKLSYSNSATAGVIDTADSADKLSIRIGGSEKARIDSSGNVGIGTSSPKTNLDVASSSGAEITLTNTTGSLGANVKLGALNFYNADASSDGANNAAIIEAQSATGTGASANLLFKTKVQGVDGSDATEAMRIDSSGNLLVGTTSVSNSGKVTIDAGANATGLYAVTDATAGYAASVFERSASDGDITVFKKGGTPVGSIGTTGGDMYVGTGDTGIRFDDATNHIRPCGVNGANLDATIDIGDSSRRFKDLYRSGSTYSTSDRNKKQDIRDLTDAEARVAVVAKGSLKAFRYIDTVEAEGDDANIHFGIIAQDLKAAFEAEGLNANNYQVLKTSTYTDDDGVEQTTYSVCYENLLAFIISAI
ncbi:tail fiber domain-containing protein, partial [Verrucomicrobiales bacterium]|nr:tail fiber domain-containing protein [Verrucomicrobiales bacterium]